MRPYRFGLILGRFQTFHNGHKQIMDTAARLCDTVGVFIGSAQESGTEKNPFTYEQRRDMILKVCKKRTEVYPIVDMGFGNNAKWGEYVIARVRECCGKTPDLFVSGREERRVDWFDSVEDVCMAELYIPKTIDISASRMREYMISGDFDSWKTFMPKELWGDFKQLRETVAAACGNKKTDSI